MRSMRETAKKVILTRRVRRLQANAWKALCIPSKPKDELEP
jgi:hypothetical protein